MAIKGKKTVTDISARITEKIISPGINKSRRKSVLKNPCSSTLCNPSSSIKKQKLAAIKKKIPDIKNGVNPLNFVPINGA